MADQTIQPPTPQGQAQVIAGLDEIALTTVRLEMYAGETRAGTATGFFFRDDKRLFLLTNRHVVRDEEKVFKPDYLLLRLHTNSKDLRQSANHRVDLYSDSKKTQKVWREIAPDIDVVAIELSLSKMTQKYVLKAFTAEQFPVPNVVVGIGEPVIIVGYPLGFYDEVFNLPVIRQGGIASVYPVPSSP